MRVSTDRQVRDGDSIPAQRDALRKYIDDHDDMIFSGEYLDDGISGTKEDRDELQRMISDVKLGKIDQILVTKLDRLYRSIRHYLNLQATLDKYRVNWLAIWEPIYDTSTPQGRLIINQMMSIAQFEAENTGQRIRQVQHYKISQGEVISGSTPLGYSIVDKHLVPNEDADAVRELFTYYSRTGNLVATVKHFAHVPSLPRSVPGTRSLLRNSKYIGVFRDNDKFCDPIINKSLFDDVQRKLEMNIRPSQHHVYIFSGLIKCDVCGSPMAGGIVKKACSGGSVPVKRYRCNKHYVGIQRCSNAHTIHEPRLEKYLLENIRPQLTALTADAGKPAKPDNRRPLLEKRLEKLKDLYINDLISLDEYKKDRGEILSEIASIPSQEASNTPDIDAIRELLKQPFEMLYKGFTEDQKRFFWRSVIREIRYTENRDIKIVFM